ncbi:cadherin-like protein 26 isoform X6 [Hylobates moloch]|uniref:cadherin-like protein 26 isoform X6 n=1 Tax=Hylobates moloch TaxID=81572 RepID=UPI00267589BB|nr:cadherin-like protein 26 isoform X6 [Hylobates moloch]XP_058290528.1 cadherin-like protein 26 isoform X6 [Hylobates moloch]XP_058290529.1 cadherin-like protein 26 isoform X6 [Hylobates moloch]XP_058290530.1 cadherin-like protein 26 isoform X6 [Hylobates moloch]
MLFLSDINDNVLALRPRSRYMEVCESAVHEPLHIEAEDPDLEPFSDPFTFELDSTWGNAEDTWKLGRNSGQSVELLTLSSLPRGNYLVPLFTGDKQGLSQKQTVHWLCFSCCDALLCLNLRGMDALYPMMKATKHWSCIMWRAKPLQPRHGQMLKARGGLCSSAQLQQDPRRELRLTQMPQCTDNSWLQWKEGWQRH